MKKTNITFLYLFVLNLFVFSLSAQSKTATGKNKKNAYLFVYFTGNSPIKECIRYAVSRDGYKYFALNNDKPILDSKIISSSGGVRDPHILRCEDGKTFYMVATDMTASKGWDSNRAMVLLKSTDLINWTSTVVNIPQRFKGFDDIKTVWAPQTIYDKEVGKYMIYWSMRTEKDPIERLYYAYANSSFTDLETDPKPLFRPLSGALTMDADIILKDNLYHLFYKTADKKRDGIKVATSSSLTSGKWTENDRFLQPTTKSVEGSCVFKLNNSNDYIMMYDLFRDHSFQFTRSSDLENFKVVDEEVSLNFHARHGTVMSITDAELENILKKWGKPSGL